MNHRFATLALSLLLGVVLAYSNHFGNGFHFDDDHTVVENLYIRDLKNIPLYFQDAGTFSTMVSNRGYRPLVTTTLAIDYAIGGGLKPQAFHASQFLSLLLTGFLLALLYRALLDISAAKPRHREVAAIAAGLFCIHTANTETVNYVIERSDLLSTLGAVLSFLVFVKRPAWRKYQLYLVPMVLGALCKPPAVMLIPLLLMYVLLFEEDLSGPDLLRRGTLRKVVPHVVRLLPAFVVATLTTIFLSEMQRRASAGSLVGGAAAHPHWDYLITQTTSYVHYLRLFILPVGLLADTMQTALSNTFDPAVIFSTLVLLALGVYAWRSSVRRETRLVTFGIAWFFLTLAPTSSLVPLSQVVSEHRIFFPYVGLMLAVAAWVSDWIDRPAKKALRPVRERRAFQVAVFVFVLLGIGTYLRNRVWATDETLWRDVTEKEPKNTRAQNNYGLVFLGRGDYEKARDVFRHTIKLNPNYQVAHINLGIALDNLGQKVEAERSFREALRLWDGNSDAHYLYARSLLEQMRLAEATVRAEAALAISPQSAKIRFLLMKIYKAAGETGKLCKLVSEALALVPNDADALEYRASCDPGAAAAAKAEGDVKSKMSAAVETMYTKKDPAAAVPLFQQILAENPTHFGATFQLAKALDATGRRAEARPIWEKLLPMAEGYKDRETTAVAKKRLSEP